MYNAMEPHFLWLRHHGYNCNSRGQCCGILIYAVTTSMTIKQPEMTFLRCHFLQRRSSKTCLTKKKKKTVQHCCTIRFELVALCWAEVFKTLFSPFFFILSPLQLMSPNLSPLPITLLHHLKTFKHKPILNLYTKTHFLQDLCKDLVGFKVLYISIAHK